MQAGVYRGAASAKPARHSARRPGPDPGRSGDIFAGRLQASLHRAGKTSPLRPGLRSGAPVELTGCCAVRAARASFETPVAKCGAALPSRSAVRQFPGGAGRGIVRRGLTGAGGAITSRLPGRTAPAARPPFCSGRPFRSGPPLSFELSGRAATRDRFRTMHAVIRTGGKQYRVAAQDVIRIEKIAGEEGEAVLFDEVLAVGSELGAPLVSGASVAGRVLAQDRADKIIVFKKKRRQNYRRKQGHRQDRTIVRIEEILTGGRKPAAAKKTAAKAPRAGRLRAGSARVGSARVENTGNRSEGRSAGEGRSAAQGGRAAERRGAGIRAARRRAGRSEEAARRRPGEREEAERARYRDLRADRGPDGGRDRNGRCRTEAQGQDRAGRLAVPGEAAGRRRLSPAGQEHDTMAHKKAGGSSRNGRDFGRPAARRQEVRRREGHPGQHHRAPARHQVPSRRQCRDRQRPHPVRADRRPCEIRPQGQ